MIEPDYLFNLKKLLFVELSEYSRFDPGRNKKFCNIWR
jgi:hypothetical protein